MREKGYVMQEISGIAKLGNKTRIALVALIGVLGFVYITQISGRFNFAAILNTFTVMILVIGGVLLLPSYGQGSAAERNKNMPLLAASLVGFANLAVFIKQFIGFVTWDVSDDFDFKIGSFDLFSLWGLLLGLALLALSIASIIFNLIAYNKNGRTKALMAAILYIYSLDLFNNH